MAELACRLCVHPARLFLRVAARQHFSRNLPSRLCLGGCGRVPGSADGALNCCAQAMSAVLGSGPQDEDDLFKVLHKRNPETGLPGSLWRCTLPEASEGEPEWFEAARAARAEVRTHVKANLADIVETLIDVDGKNANVTLQDDAALAEFEKPKYEVAKKKSSAEADEDSGDAGKENAGAARTSKPSKPLKRPAVKKRAASDCEEEDDDFQEPKAKRNKMRTATPKELEAEKGDQVFRAAVQAAQRFLDEDRVSQMRKLIVNLGLLEPTAEVFARVRRTPFAVQLESGHLSFATYCVRCSACSASCTASSPRTSPGAMMRLWLSSLSRF